MTREDIIRMAREAGAVTGVKSLLNCDGDSIVFVPEELDRFVDLVAATEREECAKWFEANPHEHRFWESEEVAAATRRAIVRAAAEIGRGME